MSKQRNVHGEGNYEASRQYNEATKRFVDSGRVDEAARQAAPRSAAEAKEMKMAEQAALLRAKTGTPKAPVEEPGATPAPIDEPGCTPKSGGTGARDTTGT